MTKKTWTIHGLLAALFLFTGTMKLVLPLAVLQAQTPLPGWFVRFLGACEFLGAFGLILPELLRVARGLTALAAAGLTVIMAGATVATLLVGGGAAALLPFAVGLVLVYTVRQFFARQPATLRVERAVRIEAPADAVYPLVEDFRQWTRWSPYENVDPEMTRNYSGAKRGVNSVYEWSGNGRAGAGRIEIVNSTPNRSITLELHFLRPFEGHKTADFTFSEADGITFVTWAMYGEQQTICKFMGSIIPMERMIGGEFEKGLKALKAISEEASVTFAAS